MRPDVRLQNLRNEHTTWPRAGVEHEEMRIPALLQVLGMASP